MIKYQGLSTLEVLTEAKNYNKWIAEHIKPHITGPALEIGAGTGNMTEQFLNIQKLYISDKDLGLVNILKKRFSKLKNPRVTSLDVENEPKKKFIGFFATIYAINVFEHISNDVVALKNINMMLKKNGTLVLLVPAKKFAYTKLDRMLGHFRRYEKDEIIKKLAKSGYKVESIRYFNIVGLLSWYIRDKVMNKHINLKPQHIRIFDSIVPFLRVIESIIRIPVGISLIVVAKKIK